MTVRVINGQSNAAVILSDLLQQHNMPALSPEGIDALAARFETELVIGNGVVSHAGRPLIDELQEIHSDETCKRFFQSAASNAPDTKSAGTLTERYRAEIEASRKQSLPDDWQQIRASTTQAALRLATWKNSRPAAALESKE